MALPVQGINALLPGAVQPAPVIYEATAYLRLLSVSAYQPVFVIWEGPHRRAASKFAGAVCIENRCHLCGCVGDLHFSATGVNPRRLGVLPSFRLICALVPRCGPFAAPPDAPFVGEFDAHAGSHVFGSGERAGPVVDPVDFFKRLACPNGDLLLCRREMATLTFLPACGNHLPILRLGRLHYDVPHCQADERNDRSQGQKEVLLHGNIVRDPSFVNCVWSSGLCPIRPTAHPGCGSGMGGSGRWIVTAFWQPNTSVDKQLCDIHSVPPRTVNTKRGRRKLCRIKTG